MAGNVDQRKAVRYGQTGDMHVMRKCKAPWISFLNVVLKAFIEELFM